MSTGVDWKKLQDQYYSDNRYKDLKVIFILLQKFRKTQKNYFNIELLQIKNKSYLKLLNYN